VGDPFHQAERRDKRRWCKPVYLSLNMRDATEVVITLPYWEGYDKRMQG